MTLVLRDARLPGSDDVTDIEILTAADGTATLGRMGYLGPGSAGTDELDLCGRFVVPGLWDNHVHFTQWAQTSRRLNVSLATSAAETAALVARRLGSQTARAAINTETLVGFGFRDGLWPDVPSRAVLDAASGSVPVVLISGDLHCCWLNSAALAQRGYGDHLTGLLREAAAFAVVEELGLVAEDVMDGWVADAAQAAAARGVVGIVDMEMTWNRDDWARRIAAGNTALRVEFGVYSQDLDRAIAMELTSGAIVDGTDGLLSVGPYKVITDGSLNTRTAYCFDEYPGLAGLPGSHGLLTVPTDELVSWMRKASVAGLRPAVHAIGDHANTLALDAFAAVGCGGSIEHAQLLTSTDIVRFAELGVVASMQPEHAMDDRDVADVFWAGRTERAFMLASLQEAGVELALGSDAPVAPLDPWVSIAAAVGRSRDDREPWHLEQAISRQAALAASARGRHAVSSGEVADLVVCEIDPYVASVSDLRQMPVAATMLNGRFTYSRL
ncbi:amidohydrolase [Leifsonia sp. A12D58]|uniref:amidohydrolase n=1 Tax=Leifsonia sp. A12D58 TaxID=3397674 RepID=UPI0039DF4F65